MNSLSRSRSRRSIARSSPWLSPRRGAGMGRMARTLTRSGPPRQLELFVRVEAFVVPAFLRDAAAGFGFRRPDSAVGGVAAAAVFVERDGLAAGGLAAPAGGLRAVLAVEDLGLPASPGL